MTTPTKTEKTFDCIEFKRRAQLQVYEHIRGMTHEQERKYFEEQAEHGPLGDWWKRIKAGHKS
jgi:hypothetical protein